MYLLWVGKEQPPNFIETKALIVAKTPIEAKKFLSKIGLPLIISFGDNSISFAKHFRSCYHKVDGFTYRVHGDKNREKIIKIMESANE